MELKIAVPKEYLGDSIDEGIRRRVLEAPEVFASLGAEWEEVSLPHSDYAVACYYLIAPSEASSNLAR